MSEFYCNIEIHIKKRSCGVTTPMAESFYKGHGMLIAQFIAYEAGLREQTI